MANWIYRFGVDAHSLEVRLIDCIPGEAELHIHELFEQYHGRVGFQALENCATSIADYLTANHWAVEVASDRKVFRKDGRPLESISVVVSALPPDLSPYFVKLG